VSKQQSTRRLLLAIVLVISSLFLFTPRFWARLTLPPYMVDIPELAEKAPLILRGHVLAVIPPISDSEPGNIAIATIEVDRWYRGTGPTQETLQFSFNKFVNDGHDCIKFSPYTYWLIFAHEESGRLQLVDDCTGALTISPLLGRKLKTVDWLAQMEADFLAGLRDPDSAARIGSIQRLGGLKLPSSRAALHAVIEKGGDAESKWAVYAALRTGDIFVLPRVQRLLAKGDDQDPERAIALQLESVTDPGALPGLIGILESAPSEFTRHNVLIALAEKLKDQRAVPALAAHLSDPDYYARYDSLAGLQNITHEEACTLPPKWKEEDVEPQISHCKLWWEQSGKFKNWTEQRPLSN
jgi:HEAT repeats